MTEKIQGELEIDHERGVIYFHCSNPRVMQRYMNQTILRICRLPKPIPENVAIDLTLMFGVSYDSPGDFVRVQESTEIETTQRPA